MNTILFQKEVKVAQRTYRTHRLLAQFAFSDDPMATKLLRDGAFAASENWLAEATEFYQIVVPLAEFMLKCGVHKDELRQTRAMVDAITTKTIVTDLPEN